MDACILYSHVVGTRSIAWQLMLWCLRPFIKIETIIGTACHCRMLCDVQTWGLWPLDLSCCTRFVFALLGCIYPHDKYSFITWSHFVLFNSYAKSRPGDTPKSDTLPSILVSGAMGWKAYLDLFDNFFLRDWRYSIKLLQFIQIIWASQANLKLGVQTSQKTFI